MINLLAGLKMEIKMERELIIFQMDKKYKEFGKTIN